MSQSELTFFWKSKDLRSNSTMTIQVALLRIAAHSPLHHWLGWPGQAATAVDKAYPWQAGAPQEHILLAYPLLVPHLDPSHSQYSCSMA